MLTYGEELMLLALDEDTGALLPLPAQALRYAVAGALLVDLAMRDRIDTDLRHLYLTDATPTGDALLDDILMRLAATDMPLTTADWLNRLAWRTPDTHPRLLERLVEKGILRREERRLLWLFVTRRYPPVDAEAARGPRARLRALIDSDEIPDPHEAVLIGLLNACQLLELLFGADDLRRLRPRIEALARLDLIAREVGRAIEEISRAMAEAMPGIT